MGRASWGIADQALASVSNLGVNVLAARTLGTAAFGAFGLAFSVYLLLVGLLRGFLIEPFAVDKHASLRSPAMSRMLGGGLALSFLATVLLAPAVFLLPLSMGLRVVIAAAIPFATFVETLRSGATSAGAPHIAFVIDAVWLGTQAVVFVVMALTIGINATWAVGSWVIGAAVGCVAGLALLGGADWASPVAALRHSAKLGGTWMLEFLVTNGTAQLLVWTVGVVALLEDVGALRGGLVLVGPSTVLIAGMRLVVLPAMAATFRDRPTQLLKQSTRWTIAFASLTLVATVPMLLIPDGFGRWLLGETWPAARATLPWLILYRTANAAANGPLLGLRAVRDRSGSLTIRVLVSGGALAGATVGAANSGARGAAAALALAFVVTFPLWHFRLRSVYASRLASPSLT